MNGDNAALIEDIQAKREKMATWKQSWKSLQKEWDSIYQQVSQVSDMENTKIIAKELAIQTHSIA
jgi:hypothetical protein